MEAMLTFENGADKPALEHGLEALFGCPIALAMIPQDECVFNGALVAYGETASALGEGQALLLSCERS